jgi:hypothetical protein
VSTKEYNPLEHSVVQACVGAWSRYECDDFIEALFDHILKEIKRVHWNIYQHTWGPSWHADEVEDPMIDGIRVVRFYQDRCDCGGMEPKCTADCRSVAEHNSWNDRRIASARPSPDAIRAAVEKGEPEWMASSSVNWSKMMEFAEPHPPCTCGNGVDWEEHECTPQCIGQQPNFQHEDVEIRWYKYPGRGMSTNKDWTAQEWRDWQSRCLATIRAFEGDHYSEENRARQDRLQKEIREKHPNVFRDGR